MGKTSKSKQKQKIQSPLSEDQYEENSGYTADFLNEEQIQELKQKESKQKILEHIKKQVATLNSRKADSKVATPANKKKTYTTKKNNKLTQFNGDHNNDNNSNQSQISLTPSKIENQSNAIGMDIQSLQSDLKHTESEFSQNLCDTTFPELNQIDELIEKKFGEFTSKAREDLSNKLLKQVPDLIKTPLFQKLTDQIKEQIGRVTKLETLFNDVELESIQRRVANGREEINQKFQILVEDIKKVSPTIGIATQESLAKNVRRINDQIVQLNKTIQDLSSEFQKNIRIAIKFNQRTK